MKIIPLYRAVVVISILVLSFTLGRGNGVAMDEGGCLTCHQYPGLTRPEKPDGFKVFHIDENRYLLSPHGKIDCRKCHSTMHKVPHVGETAVNCNKECHLTEKDKKLIADYDFKTLHSQEKSYLTRLEDGSSCNECHDLYPHRSNELARAFINMHIGFMTCETCHINREKFNTLKYDWTSLETAEFAGKPFGARFNPKIGAALKSAHFISRIAVFSVKNREKKQMLNTWDTQKAREYLAREKNLTPDEREERLRYFHQDIHKKEISVTCDECHSKHSILDFKQLGFSEKKATDLIYLNIKGLVTKYKVFFFPEMFQR